MLIKGHHLIVDYRWEKVYVRSEPFPNNPFGGVYLQHCLFPLSIPSIASFQTKPDAMATKSSIVQPLAFRRPRAEMIHLRLQETTFQGKHTGLSGTRLSGECSLAQFRCGEMSKLSANIT